MFDCPWPVPSAFVDMALDALRQHDYCGDRILLCTLYVFPYHLPEGAYRAAQGGLSRDIRPIRSPDIRCIDIVGRGNNHSRGVVGSDIGIPI